MNKAWKIAGSLGLILLLASHGLDAQIPLPEEKPLPFHPSRLIAKYKSSGGMAKSAALNTQGVRVAHEYKLLPRTVLLEADPIKSARVLAPGEQASQLKARLAALRRSGLFEYVEPDYVHTINLEPADAAYIDGTLWALHNYGQNEGSAGADIGAPAAWDTTTGSTNVIVAVLDTGILYTHQELTNQMWQDPAATNFVCGTNAVAGNEDPLDDNVSRYGEPIGHGTHVAGTIGAAANDGHPHVGVAWDVRLMACKFLNAQGRGYISDAIRCMEYAASKGARIINASYGSYYYSQAEFEAIRALHEQGVLLVTASSNEHNDNDSDVRAYPASYDLPNILSVCALDRSDRLADFSNFGRRTVHLGAPGVEIFSCMNASNSAYASYDGTSMAAPHVSGAAALVLAGHPGATLAECRQRILLGVEPVDSLAEKTITGGRLNVFNALGLSPSGSLNLEVSPRNGQPVTGNRITTLRVVTTDIEPVTNATLMAAISSLTNLTLLDDGVAPDTKAQDGIYYASFLVPTNMAVLEVVFTASAPAKLSITNQFAYPVVPPPINDHFSERIPISTVPCNMTVTGTNLNGSLEPGEPTLPTQTSGHSVWWSWTPTTNGLVKVSTYGSPLDTVLAVFTGGVVSNLTVVATNDDAASYDYYSMTRFEAVAGVQYQVMVDGYGGSQGTIVLTITPLTSEIPADVAVDCPGLNSSTGGSLPWQAQACLTHEASPSALKSGPIEAYEDSWLETDIPGPGTLGFWWKVSSEYRYDPLRFLIDGVEQVRISGEVDWEYRTFELAPGNHKLQWVFSKDIAWGGGQDAAWLDEVSFAPVRKAIPPLLGDLDGDGHPTILDLTLLVNFMQDTNSLRPEVGLFADLNADAAVDTNDVAVLVDAIMERRFLPRAADTDGDGLPDDLERFMGLDPNNEYSLPDGVVDGDRDTDQDSISNDRELLIGTNPTNADGDGDGWWDEAELTAGSDPLNAQSRPFMMVISAPPVSLLVPANEGPNGLPANTIVARPEISVLLPAHVGTEGLPLNSVIARPPVSVLLPADEGFGGLPFNTVLGLPPVSILLPADVGADGLPLNTTLAKPPVSVLLPAHVGTEGLPLNSVIAQPPVSVLLPADEGFGGLPFNTVLGLPPISILLPFDTGSNGLTNNTVIAQPPVVLEIETE